MAEIKLLKGVEAMTTEKLSKISRSRIRETSLHSLHRYMVQTYVDGVLFENERRKYPGAISTCIYGGTIMAISTNIAYAANDYATDIQAVLQQFINLFGIVFQAVGVILAIYGFIQLVLSIRNDDPDSKSRAGTQLVVGAVLFAAPKIIASLDLIEKIGT